YIFSPWLFKIVYNTAINYIKKQKNYKKSITYNRPQEFEIDSNNVSTYLNTGDIIQNNEYKYLIVFCYY
ncbi:MAG: hypothetical protein AAF688_09720, partial [Bacteroidota bacterium]